MNVTNLDLDTLRTLVVASDLGGFGQAADRLSRTPPAVSLQMKRLQLDLGMALFRKHGRKLTLTEFRQRAMQRLEASGVSHRLTASSPSLNGLWAAALGRLGLTARTALGLPDGLVHGPALFGLPKLGSLPVHLHLRDRADGPALERMRALFADAVTTSLEPPSAIRKRR